LQIIIHESGHLVFGLLTGYKFQSFRVGSLMLKKTDSGLRFCRFKIAGTGGQCLMCPPDMKDGSIPYFLYNAGGSLMNLISVIVFYLISLTCPGTAFSLILKMGAVIGLGFAATNGIPLSLPGIDNDGANIVSMRKNPEAIRALYSQLKISELASKNIRLKDMPQDLFELPDNADINNSLMVAVAVMNEERLCDMHHFDSAEAEASKLLSLGNSLPGLYSGLLTCDMILFKVLRGEDPSSFVTDQFKKIMKTMRSNPSICRTNYILSLIEGDQKKVNDSLQAFDKIAATYPNQCDIDSEREYMSLAAEMIRLKSKGQV